MKLARDGESQRIVTGADPGGGVLGVRTPFWGTPKLHKEGEKTARMHAETPRFST